MPPTTQREHAPAPTRAPRVLLTGATGYVGGRLLPALRAGGAAVRCLARRPEQLARRLGDPAVEVVGGDVLDLESLCHAFADIDVAYYLVHSMGTPTGSFESRDRAGAKNFARAARAAGVRRIVYLGGLGEQQAQGALSSHLRSRQEVGEVLRSSGVEVIELRASIVIGSGSLSFEMVRALSERLPLMITPRWVESLAQPIAIEDLVDYLVAALDTPPGASRVVQIGGPDRVSYGGLMREYARQRGLRRWMLRVPLLTPRLSSLWLGLVTPVYARVGRKLVDSIRNPTVVTDDSAARAFPRLRPRGVREAIARALQHEDQETAATRWSDALSATTRPRRFGGVRFGARLVDSRSVTVDAAPQAAFTPIRRIGGARGWYFASWLWQLRGLLDLLVGGVGMRRGRRDPETLRVGDVVDFWRVEAHDPERRLRLAAEMRLPGRAWLELEVAPAGEGRSTIRQTAIFDPVGLLGLAYWYAIYPLHAIVFRGMLTRLAAAATAEGARKRVTEHRRAA